VLEAGRLMPGEMGTSAGSEVRSSALDAAATVRAETPGAKGRGVMVMALKALGYIVGGLHIALLYATMFINCNVLAAFSLLFIAPLLPRVHHRCASAASLCRASRLAAECNRRWTSMLTR
jgi:hypothetical protein